MARIKHSLVRAKDIRAGKSYWTFYKLWGEGWKVKKINVRTRMIGYAGDMKLVCYGQNYFPGDLGVSGTRYDNRPTQMFNNKRSAQFWLDHYLAKLKADPSKIGFNFFDRGIHN